MSSGGCHKTAPDPSTPFTYLRRLKTGTQKKIVVRDVHDDGQVVAGDDPRETAQELPGADPTRQRNDSHIEEG